VQLSFDQLSSLRWNCGNRNVIARPRLRIWQACISRRMGGAPHFSHSFKVSRCACACRDAIRHAPDEPRSDAHLVGRCHDQRFLVNVRCAEEV